MEYKYNLAKLQYDKEKLEELIARQSRRVGQVFPKKLETQFWITNLDRARDNINQYVWIGVLTYFILTLLMIPGDYWIIEKAYFSHDFVRCLAGLVNGALCLGLLYVFAHYKKLNHYFPHASMVIVFWAVISMSWLTMTVYTPALKHQAMMIICMIYILGYILTGVKPVHMLMTGLMAAMVTMMMLFSLYVKFDAMVMGRVLIGSCVLGFVISKMLCARERMIFLSMLRADISEKIHRIHTTELLHLSQHDELTKISNRRTFDEMLDTCYEQAKRDESALSILFIDVDHFKNYNDFYGHQKGDDVISSIAKTVKNAIRHMDFVARYGGEEFVVLLPETDAHGAYAVASNIYKAIDRLEIPHAKSTVSSHVTISLGITVFRGEELSKEDLLSIADQALYRAKQLGRNQIYYQSIRSAQVA
ncbi:MULTISPECIES: diguanylate cyclase [Acinetobacter]|jgi:diguanylate cyclase (GGDEF)-like protein|uniref:diguanylate cyclase n=1 Tax=Acinetobacter entericus TaxID=2989714 RepID=A0ABT3NMY7_9GAMM|nr:MULTISPECIES: diguanylate cyclase [Acinetobacter]MCW8040924.1 GGDEF domain-containing protein [Acinetobacter entericus]TCB74596.1 GGDEF domain-containing protein [Acinetobacter sp. ANC 4177]